ncbi:MAG: helix-turn-helix transcriptional regulator [Gemmatimonadaceae bacterium]
MSRSGFAARFTELVGDPPLRYLARWRMNTAARLLSQEQMSIGAVADRVGYANPVAFSKALARIQGVAPGAFRRGERDGAHRQMRALHT